MSIAKIPKQEYTDEFRGLVVKRGKGGQRPARLGADAGKVANRGRI
jgi:hypothetical protein